MRRASAALLALVALAGCRAADTGAAAKAKPEIHVLTSLPLLFDEGFGLDPAKGEAAAFLHQRYRLRPIDLPSQLPPGATLLAAQPRALPAEQLVALDAWLRGGGRLLLLADPMLEWPSERPLGHRLRPPVSFADTGLLLHWGLRLDAPEELGPRLASDGGPKRPGDTALKLRVTTISPGSLARQGGSCSIQVDGLYAECRLGKGRAWIIADADWLNAQLVNRAGGDIDANLVALGTMIRAASSTR